VDLQFYIGETATGDVVPEKRIANATSTAVEQIQNAMECLWSYKTALELTDTEHGGCLDDAETTETETELQLWGGGRTPVSEAADAETAKCV
jgi:hypothetical protein